MLPYLSRRYLIFVTNYKHLKSSIFIRQISTISPLGSTAEEVWDSYLKGIPKFERRQDDWMAGVPGALEEKIVNLKQEPSYKELDRSVLLAILAAREMKDCLSDGNIGVNIGSSRGATQLFEKYHQQFQEKGKVSPFSSPTTTLGNISSWVGQDLGLQGVQIGHSVTCSTALHAMLNGIAWLQSGMADGFIVGGSEAALTPFTLAQMKAMKLYSQSDNILACESMRFQKKKNTMILGEGVGLAMLESGNSNNAVALIKGVGYASESIRHGGDISEKAICFQKSMRNALKDAGLSEVDMLVMHAPGTAKGDLAEKNAIDLVFGKQLPLLTSNKWLIGHTFGASGMLSVEMGVLMLQHNKFIENPFYSNARHLPTRLNTVMINAVGFGGNAVSIIIEKP